MFHLLEAWRKQFLVNGKAIIFEFFNIIDSREDGPFLDRVVRNT
jgi:hypothetical protein